MFMNQSTVVKTSIALGILIVALLHPIIAPSSTASQTGVNNSRANSPPASVQVAPSTTFASSTTDKSKRNRLRAMIPVTRARVLRAEETTANTEAQIQNLSDTVNNHAVALDQQTKVDEKFTEEVSALRTELKTLSDNFTSERDAASEKYVSMCVRVENIERQHAALTSQANSENPPAPDPNAATKQELEDIKQKLEEKIENLKQQAQHDSEAHALLTDIRAEMASRKDESKKHDVELQENRNTLNSTKADLDNSHKETAKMVAAFQKQLSDMQNEITTLTQRCETAELKAAAASVSADNANNVADSAHMTANQATSTANAASESANAASATATEAGSKPTVIIQRIRPIPRRRGKPVVRMPSKVQKRTTELPRHHITQDALKDFFYVVYYLSEEYSVGTVPLPRQICTQSSQNNLKQKYSMSNSEVEQLNLLCHFLTVLPVPLNNATRNEVSPALVFSAQLLLKLINYAHLAYDKIGVFSSVLLGDLDMVLSVNANTIKESNRITEDSTIRIPFSIVGDHYD